MTTSAPWRTASTTAVIAIVCTGCGAPELRPDSLRVPVVVSCIHLPEAMSYIAKARLVGPDWRFSASRGPYFSERESDDGTYFRGPPGAIYLTGIGKEDAPASWISNMTLDGGLFLPRDRKTPPLLYYYFSTTPVTARVPPANVDCASTAYITDPVTSGVSIVELASAGAAGGAAGGVAGRALNLHSGVSYGQAAGTGAVGGAIGMGIVGAIINASVGKISTFPEQDPMFSAKLRQLADQMMPLKPATPPQAPAASEAMPATGPAAK